MMRPTFGIRVCVVVLGLLAGVAQGAGPGPWRDLDAQCKGDLDAMLARVRSMTPPPALRFNRPFDSHFAALKAAGRFQELGLKEEEGRVLLRAVYERFKIPLEPPARSRSSSSSPLVSELPGYRPRAEFAPMDAVLMRWPFPSRPLGDEYVFMVRTFIEGGAHVYIWVDSEGRRKSAERQLAASGIGTEHLTWILKRTDSIWMRDYGPVFVYPAAGDAWAVADFHYYASRKRDDQTPLHVAELFGVPVVDRQTENVVFTEGGNLMTDGLGAIVYSSRTYENNAWQPPAVLDGLIGSALQASKALVPAAPSLDGTGHVDMFLKIVSEDTVVIGQYRPDQPDYQVLEDCAALFERSSNGAGQPWRVVRVPQPDIYYAYFVLPVVRTFTNGLIVNDRVIVPVYGIAEDAQALEIFARELPGRRVIGLNANEIIESAGAWHCVTMEYPQP